MAEEDLIIRCVGNKRMLCLRFKSHRDIKKDEIVDITLPMQKIKKKIEEECL